MPKFDFGKQFDNSRSKWRFFTDGASDTEVTVGDQHDNSDRDVEVYDLARLERLDPTELVPQLQRLSEELRRHASTTEERETIGNVEAAASAASKRDLHGTGAHLKQAGKWAFDVATKIGTSVAAEAVKAALGL